MKTQPLNHSTTQPLNHSTTQPLNHSTTQLTIEQTCFTPPFLVFRKIILRILFILSLYFFSYQMSGYAGSIDKQDVQQYVNNVQGAKSGFVKNIGQVVDLDKNLANNVLYVLKADGVKLYITTSGVMYSFAKIQSKTVYSKFDRPENIVTELASINMVLEKTTIGDEQISAENPVDESFINFYGGNIGAKGLNLQAYKKLTIQNIYPNIDWVFKIGDDNSLKYDFVIHPNGDVKNIKLTYNGAENMMLNADANRLSIQNHFASLSEGSLYCYDQINEKQIASSYLLNGKTVTYQLASYNKLATVVIDPPIIMKLTWATYYGGTNDEISRGIAVDLPHDRVYITGYAYDVGFPIVNNGVAYYISNAGFSASYDAWLVCFNIAGVRQYATYYFSTEADFAYDVAVDNNGAIYMVGSTASYALSTLKFPSQNAGGFNQTVNFTIPGNLTGFIVKFNPNGTLNWSTLFGGDVVTEVYAATCNTSNDLLITGTTISITKFPILPGGGFMQPAKAGPALSSDAFIASFTSGTVQKWGTYYGGSAGEEDFGIITDASNNIYLTGRTFSSNFPTQFLAGAYNDNSLSGSEDAFILKFSPGTARTWATYFGGISNEQPVGIDYSAATNKIGIAGSTNSISGFPALYSAGSYNPPIKNTSDFDAFVSIFNASTCGLQYSVALGGTGDDFAKAITLGNSAGNIFVTGYTNSGLGGNNNFPAVNTGQGCYFDGSCPANGQTDMFITNFTTAYSINWSTFYGIDIWSQIPYAMESAGKYLFISGQWENDNTPPYTYDFTINPAGAYIQSQGGAHVLNDAFIMKFDAENQLLRESGFDSQTLYPNPTNALINLNINSNEVSFNISIFDLTGRLISSKVVQNLNGKITYDISTFDAGLYFMQVSGKTEVTTHSFIKN